MDADIARIAQVQHGAVALAQLTGAGLSRNAIHHRVTSGRLTVLRPGVYAVGGTARSFEQLLMGAVLAAGAAAVASHEAAAKLWGIEGFDRARLEITTARADQRRLRGVRSHRTVAWLDDGHTTISGIPVTSFARTLVDLSARFEAVRLGRTLDEGLRRGHVTLEELRTCVSGLRPAPGRRPELVKRLLARRLPGYDPGDSDLELRFVRALVAAGFPQPEQQVEVRIGGRRYRLDLAYLAWRIAIEVDGFVYHRERSAFDGDRRKANALVLDGWTVLRWTAATTNAAAVADISALVRSRAS